MSETETLHQAVEAFIAEAGITPTRFGVEAAADPMLVFRLRKGRELRTALRQRVLAYIEQRSPSRKNKARNKA